MEAGWCDVSQYSQLSLGDRVIEINCARQTGENYCLCFFISVSLNIFVYPGANTWFSAALINKITPGATEMTRDQRPETRCHDSLPCNGHARPRYYLMWGQTDINTQTSSSHQTCQAGINHHRHGHNETRGNADNWPSVGLMCNNDRWMSLLMIIK